jgi:ribosome-binding factor A
VRFTPTLTFALDKVPEVSQKMEELLARAAAADAELARVREGAKPAGDPDPYRVSGVEESAGGAADDTDEWDAEESVDRDRPEH